MRCFAEKRLARQKDLFEGRTIEILFWEEGKKAAQEALWVTVVKDATNYSR